MIFNTSNNIQSNWQKVFRCPNYLTALSQGVNSQGQKQRNSTPTSPKKLLNRSISPCYKKNSISPKNDPAKIMNILNDITSVNEQGFQLSKQPKVQQPFWKNSNIGFLKNGNRQIIRNSKSMSSYPRNYYSEVTNGRKWKQLHLLFTEQAKKTPKAIAIDDGIRAYTYQELDQITDYMAGYLQINLGVKVGDSVAIYMERSLEYIMSYIAILKAGGGYLPVEMNNPVTNIKKMLKTGDCSKIISKRHLNQELEEIKQAQPHQNIFYIDEYNLKNKSTPYNTQLVQSQTLDDLAFIVLSSGSTGEPKGISAPHRASVHGYLERNEFNQYKVGDKVGCNIFFVWEILRPLLQGATVVPIPETTIFDPRALVNFIHKHKLTEVLFTPSLLETVINTVDKETFLKKTKSMKTYYLNGEPVKVSLKQALIKLLPKKVNILNTYSISECHDVANENIRESKECSSGFITCGIPTDKVEVMLLDLNTKEQINERGVEGEVYIGGPGVANGYLNGPPDLNENGFPIINGKKYHRTGDIGIVHQDGRLEIKGRCNTKVKLRGYTIFLGSVEKTLTQQLKLKSSIVVLDEPNQKMTGYLLKGEETVDFTIRPDGTCPQIRQILKEKLPDYSIPQYFVEINEIPINILSGKANKKLLPQPPYLKELAQEQQDAENKKNVKIQPVAGPIPYEEELKIVQQIWAQVLDLEPSIICEKSNFFDIGGHSLVAVQAITYYEQVFGIHLTVQTLYENPELKQFIDAVQQIRLQENEVDHTVNSPKFIEELHNDAHVIEDLEFNYSQDQPKTVQESREVLITGTTGFLGCFILNDLLQNLNQLKKIHCVVRAKTEQLGLERIHKNLQYYQLFDNLTQEQLSKIVPVIGDISQNNLGINEQNYQNIRKNVDFVYHVAAAVNFVQPYSYLKPATVDGTEHVLNFCSSNQDFNAKKLYFVSTNGILPPHYGETFKENKQIDNYIPKLVNDGYGQSKWVAEKMMWIAEHQGLQVSAFRLGNVGHVSKSGAKNPIDFQSQLIETCKIVNSMPDCDDWKLEATPVDFIARCMVGLATQRDNFGKVYHIIENDTVNSLEVFKLLKKRKHVQNIDSYQVWCEKVNQKCAELKSIGNNKQYETVFSIKESLADLQKYLTDSNDYDRSQIRSDLKEINIEYNSVDADYYEKILSLDQNYKL